MATAEHRRRYEDSQCSFLSMVRSSLEMVHSRGADSRYRFERHRSEPT